MPQRMHKMAYGPGSMPCGLDRLRRLRGLHACSSCASQD